MSRDPYHSHVACVDALAAHGITPPRGWQELRDRFSRFLALQHPCTHDLAAAIVTGGDAPLGLLRAAALAEHATSDEAAIGNVVRASVLGRLIELYEPAAAKNYKQTADEFDKAAALFTKAAKTCDPNLDSDQVIRQAEHARRAWLDAAVLAAELDQLTPVLAAAAHLAGADADIASLGPDADPWRIPLIVDTAKLHRRRVWEAWQPSDSRCGRWAILLQLKARIRAHAHPEKLAPYDRPRPYTVRWVPGPQGGHKQHVIDPEDNPNSTVSEEAETVWSA